MKKLACSLVIALVMGLSVNTFAQKTTAFIVLKTAKQVVDEKTAIVTFRLDNINDEQGRLKFQDLFKSSKGVLEVNSSMKPGNMAEYSLKVEKQGTLDLMAQVLTRAGVESVDIDGTPMPTRESVKYIKDHQAKK
jgi:hypothetical protein